MSNWHRSENSREFMAAAVRFGDTPFLPKDVFNGPSHHGVVAGAFKAGWIVPVERVGKVSTWKLTNAGKRYGERFI